VPINTVYALNIVKLKMVISVNDKNLGFIQQKINMIRSALFFNARPKDNFSATSIISALRMDENGGIWFFLNNDAYMQSNEEDFPARLSFYRKGIPFSVNIYGKASIVRDLRHISELTGINLNCCSEISEKVLLIKVKVYSAEYREWQTGQTRMRAKRFLSFINRLLQPFYPSYEETTAQYIFN